MIISVDIYQYYVTDVSSFTFRITWSADCVIISFLDIDAAHSRTCIHILIHDHNMHVHYFNYQYKDWTKLSLSYEWFRRWCQHQYDVVCWPAGGWWCQMSEERAPREEGVSESSSTNTVHHNTTPTLLANCIIDWRMTDCRNELSFSNPFPFYSFLFISGAPARFFLFFLSCVLCILYCILCRHYNSPFLAVGNVCPSPHFLSIFYQLYETTQHWTSSLLLVSCWHDGNDISIK